MKRPFLACLLTLLVFTAPSCSGGDETETVAERKPAKEEETPHVRVAPVLARPDLLAGEWLQPALESGRAGMSIEPDGRLMLVGVMQVGVDWSLDGDVLVLRTLVAKTREPSESRLPVVHLDENTLQLRGLSSDFAGTYSRAELGRVTCTVASSDTLPLGENERLYVRLYAPLASGGAAKAVIGHHGMSGPAEWPVSLALAYDPEAVPAGAQLEIEAVVNVGTQTLHRSPRAPVAAGESAGGVSLVVEPVRRP
ncbi:MAG: hypothetical protein OEO21_05510 [Candidatus Krumholzibacteria bacterium]|nr:hypothetical protein [Candidatus Krumholzibacteria bacterium]